MQGIHFGKNQHKLMSYSNNFLLDLVGNSFHAWCCGAVLLTSLIVLSEARARHRRRQRPALHLQLQWQSR